MIGHKPTCNDESPQIEPEHYIFNICDITCINLKELTQLKPSTQRMLGVAIGVISSIVIFVFYGYDKQAVEKYKKEKKQQIEKKEKQRQEREAQIKEHKQKIANDPQLKKRKQESEKRMKAKLFEGVSESDKKLLDQYLDDKRKSGKTDAEIIKQATNKAGLFMMVTFVLVIILVIAIILLTQGQVDLSKVENDFRKVLTSVFPRFGNIEGSTTTSTDL